MTRGSISHSYDYIPACSLHPNYQGHQLVLTMRQQPIQARVSTSNERDRKPIEPPPIIQIQLNRTTSSQEMQDFLQNPYFFMYVNLVNPVSKELVSQPQHQILSGQTVSSMYKLKDVTDQDGGFFCFGDLSSRIQGEYQLKFSLFEIVADGIINLMHTFSNVFKVYNSKSMPGLVDATFLSRSFADQGVRIRIRKEHRVQVTNSKKRKLSAEDQDNHQQIAQSPPPHERDSRHSSLTGHHLTTNSSANSSTSYYCTSTHHSKQQDECMISSDIHYQPLALVYPTHTYNSNMNAHSFSPTPYSYDLRSRQNSMMQQQQQHLSHLHAQEFHAHERHHHYHRHSGPTSSTLSPPSMKMDHHLQRYRRQSTDDKIMFPLSPRPSISSIETTTTSSDFECRRRSTTSSLSTATTTESSPHTGWNYLRYPLTVHSGDHPPPSPTNNTIRLPPLHTMIPNPDAIDNENDNNHDDKSDAGHVNAAVAMMQLSQHQHDPEDLTHPCDSDLLDPFRRLSTDTLDRKS